MDLNSDERKQEIEQFLCDVREHFKASLETSEYENTSNLFHMTEAETTARLLQRCELLLQQYTHNNNNSSCNNNIHKKPQHHHIEKISSNIKGNSNSSPLLVNEVIALQKLNGLPHKPHKEQEEEASYLDMSSTVNKKSGCNEYMDFHSSTDSDKTFRCSAHLPDVCDGQLKHLASNESICEKDNTGTDDGDDDSFDEDAQIYDICQVSQVDTDSSFKCIKECPYMNLPAGHLAIQKSTKYGQLQRIEKRLFFDQSKKCYCGILNDWLLCYADGPTASHPTTTLHLRTPGIEIEHSGEGKRREICFQITVSGDLNKKLVFQANNEVDAKEWIHAIETAIRNDIKQSPRKLPTPPIVKKITFIDNNHPGNNNTTNINNTVLNTQNHNDCIYEEPSPVYDVHTIAHDFLVGKPPDLPDKLKTSESLAKKYEYDIPKCPAQPIIDSSHDECKAFNPSGNLLNDSGETMGLLNIINAEHLNVSCNGQKTKICLTETMEKIDFQSKVKDLHSKLSSQLLTGGSAIHTERLLKKSVKKTLSNTSTESESLTLTTPPTTKDLKKHKKSSSNTPNVSPQKSSNNNTNNNNNNSNNNGEKSAKNWFLNRLNKSTSVRNSTISQSSSNKCRHSEKENLLNNLDICENFDSSSNPSSPILKSNMNGTDTNSANNKSSKVNMIINQFEANGVAMFSMANLSAAFSDSDCNNYEPIMTVSTPPSSFLKNV